MADVKFKQIAPGASNAEICRYINNFVEDLGFMLRNLDEDNTVDEYVTAAKSSKDIKKAGQYAATERDIILKKLKDEIGDDIDAAVASKDLFAGTWTTGTQNLTGWDKYNLFLIEVKYGDNYNATVLAHRGNYLGTASKNYIIGTGDIPISSNHFVFFEIVINCTAPGEAYFTLLLRKGIGTTGAVTNYEDVIVKRITGIR